MKLAMLHYSYAPVAGGVEFVMEQHTALFADHGHEVQMISMPELSANHPLTRAAQRELDAGQPAEKFSGLTRRFAEMLTPVLRNVDILFVHNVLTMHFNLACTAALWQIAQASDRARVVCWIHDLAACNPDYNFPQPDRAPWDLLRASHPQVEYVAVSEHRRQQFEKLTGATCRVIPNGIDPVMLLGLSEPVAKFVNERNILDHDIVLLHPARLLKRKNIELGLHTTAALKQQSIRALLLITGAPDPHNPGSLEYEAYLKSLAKELDLEREALFLHGYFDVTRRDLASLYNIADALFYPSKQEGFGLPLLEAALHRLPVFCPDIEPLKSLAPRNTTFFPLSIDPSELAERVRICIASSSAIQSRKEILRNHSWKSIYPVFLEPLLFNN